MAKKRSATTEAIEQAVREAFATLASQGRDVTTSAILSLRKNTLISLSHSRMRARAVR